MPQTKDRRKQLYQLNKTQINQKRRDAYAQDKKSNNQKYLNTLQQAKDYWYKNHANNIIVCSRRKKNDRKNNPEKFAKRWQKYEKNLKIVNPTAYKMRLIRDRMRRFFQQKKLKKTNHTVEALGCTGQFFHEYITEKMKIWNATHDEQMTHMNIDLDHIKPGSLAQNEEDMMKLSHWTNIQPLLKRHNGQKRNKWSKEDEIHWTTNIYQNHLYREIYWPKACTAMT